ncbi:MAG: hypothetical protein ACTSSE_06875 [Candidatus Thorarchaeota archaeon]
MSSKEEQKLSKALEKAENTARIRLFKKASSQYSKLIKLAKPINPKLIPGFAFLSHLYLVNHDISQRNDPLATGTLHQLDSLKEKMDPINLTMALPGGIFGEYSVSRVFTETRALLLMSRGKNESSSEILSEAIELFLEIGREQLFFGRYVHIIRRRINGVRAALECEGESHVIEASSIADVDPSGAIPGYMMAIRAYRAARRNDLEKQYRSELIGLKQIGKCWLCGRTVQGANHFRILESDVTPYFKKLLVENKEDMRTHRETSIVACSPCAKAIEMEAHRIAGEYHKWTVRQFELVQEQMQKITEMVDVLYRERRG